MYSFTDGKRLFSYFPHVDQYDRDEIYSQNHKTNQRVEKKGKRKKGVQRPRREETDIATKRITVVARPL